MSERGHPHGAAGADFPTDERVVDNEGLVARWPLLPLRPALCGACARTKAHVATAISVLAKVFVKEWERGEVDHSFIHILKPIFR